jgi:hypothetical protein
LTITIHLENDKKLNLTETVNIWKDGKDSFWLEAEITLKPVSVELANKNIPDSNLLNNKFEIKAKLFRKDVQNCASF